MKRILIVNFFFRKCMLLIACLGCFFWSTNVLGATNNNGDNTSSCDLDIYINNCNVTCYGAMDGSVNVNVSNGVEPYTYTWSMAGIPSDEDHPNTLGPGTYYVTITDAEGCTAEAEEVVYGPPELIVNLTSTNATCGNNDGSISVDVSGGDDPYQYLWSNGSTESSLSNLAAGTYSLTVIDSDPCQQVREITITDDCAPCEADAGTLTLNGSSPFCLENGSTLFSATPNGDMVVPSGYDVLYVLTSGADLVIVGAGVQPEFIVDDAGSYTIHTLVYDAATLDLSAIIFGTTTGVDVLNIIESQGLCASLDVAGAPVVVEVCTSCEADAGTLTLNGASPICLENGSAIFSATPNGDMVVPSGYDVLYVLTSGADLVIVGAGAQPEFTVDGVGSYTIHTLVYDAATLDLSGIIFGTTTGVDVLNIIESQGLCASLDVPGAPVVVEICNDCEADAGTLTLSGASPICIENGSAIFSATSNGDMVVPPGYEIIYVLTTGADLVILGAGAEPEFLTGNAGTYTIHTLVYDPTTLDLGVIVLGTTTGVDVLNLIQNQGICASLDVAGAVIMVENCDDCKTPVLESVVVIEPACDASNGSAVISVVGNEADYSYTWTPDVSSTNSAMGLSAGVYTVVIQDPSSADCPQIEETFTVANRNGPDVEIVGTNPATCNEMNGTAAVLPMGLQYLWCNGSTGNSVINLPAGECYVTVTDPISGCTDVLEVMIEEVNPLMVDATINNYPDCGLANGSVTIEASNGSTDYNYVWDDGTTGATRDNLAAGVYTVEVTDNGPTGCTKSFTFTLSNEVIGNAIVSFDTPVMTTCVGSSDARIEYTIDFEPDFVQPASIRLVNTMGVEQTNGELSGGTYCIEVKDGNDCFVANACLEVTEPSQIDVDIALANFDCFNFGKITLTDVSGGNGGYIYDWGDLPGSNNTKNRTELIPGLYNLTVTDMNGCSVVANDIAIIEEEACCINPPVIASLLIYEANCGVSNGSAVFDMVGDEEDFEFLWSPPVASDQEATLVPAGDYMVTITDKTDSTCFIIHRFTLGTKDGPEATLETTLATCDLPDGTATLTPNNYTYEWFDGVTTDFRDDLATGYYGVTVTDPDNPECKDLITVFIDSKNPLEATVTVNEQPDCQMANGSVTIEPEGGSGSYSYSWGDATQANLSGGSYFITVTDLEWGCKTVVDFVLTDDVPGADIIPTVKDVLCIGDENGSVTYEITNIDPAFALPEMVTLVNSGGQILSSTDNLAAGMYCLRLKDANGCIAGGACFDVKEPTQLDVDVADAPQTCDVGGSITLAISGATGPYTVDWADLPGSNNAINRVDLSEGTYTAVITDVNGCSLTVSNVVVEKDCPCVAPVITSVVLVETECGMSNGRATVNIAGGPAAYVFNWEDNVSSTHQAFNLSEGTYKVTITDPTNPEICTLEETFTVGNIGGPIFDVTTVRATCGASDGQAVFSPNAFEYQWSDTNEETNFRLDLPEGMYQVTITDPLNPTCIDVQTVVIESDNSLDLSVTTNTEPNCNSADGSVTINTGDTNGTYTYSWGTRTKSDLVAGTYTVVVKDENSGCEDEITFTLNNNVPTASITINNLPSISCPGANDGTLDFIINVTGVVGTTQTRIVDGNGNIYTNGNLPPGDFCLVIIDENDCIAGNSCFRVMPPTQIDVDIAITDETCTDMGNITLVSVSGGNGGYTYAWGDGPTTRDRTDLAAEDYDLMVVDVNGCPVSETLTVDDSTYILQVLLTPTDISCDSMGNGAITSTVNGGILTYDYLWNNSSTDPDLMGIDTGTYALVVTDMNGCTGSAETTIIEPPAINLQLPADTTICGGAILVSAEADVALTYSWMNITTGQSMGTNSAVLVQPDSFSVIQVNVLDAFGCTAEQTIRVDNGTLNVQLSGPSITCNGANLDLSATNLNPNQILTYDWGPTEYIMDGANTANPSVMISEAGTVQFVANITNQYGCMMTDSVGITAIDTSETPDILVHWMCEERTVNYSIVGGLGNVYTLNFGDPENPDSTTTALESTYTYPATGNYSVSLTIPGLESCFVPLTKEIEVLEPPFITASYETITEECADSAIIVLTDQSSTAFGNIINWEWNFSNNTSATGTNPTVILYESQTLGIELIVENEFGCMDTILNEMDIAVVTLNPPDTVMACPNTPVALNPDAADGLVYEWTPSTYLDNPNSPNPFVTAPGGTNILYTVMARDSSDICMKEEQVELMVTPDMTNISFPDDTYTCEEEQVVLNASSEEAVMVSWYDDNNVFISNDSLVTSSGDAGTSETYTVVLVDADGCMVSEDIVIGNANVTADFEASDEVICLGDETMIQSVGLPTQINGADVSYSWSPASSIVNIGADSSEIFVQPTETTLYEVEINNSFGCTSSTEVAVNVTDLTKLVSASADPDTIFDGQFTTLNATQNISYNYLWTGDNLSNTDSDAPQASPSTNSDYEVLVTDENGCTATATVRVTVLNPDCEEPYIFFPNAFTPNGDGFNDVLYLRAPFAVTEAYFVIYSRWGEKMFESNSIDVGWDGTYKGKLCNDVFGYYLRVVCDGGEEYIKKGNVTILK